MTIPATPKRSVPEPTNRDTAMTAITEGGSAEKSLSSFEETTSSSPRPESTYVDEGDFFNSFIIHAKKFCRYHGVALVPAYLIEG